MKKLKVLGVAGVMSLAVGTTVFAADFSGNGRMIGHHMNPASCAAGGYVRTLAGITAAQCNFGNCNYICGNWGEYCRNYIAAVNTAVNVSGSDAALCESGTDTADTAVYDSYVQSTAVYDDYSTGYGYGGNYVDADNDGVCDNWQDGGYGGGYGNGGGYVDADNNGVCDNWQDGGYGGGYGNGNGHCGGYGNGGYGGGHHGGGHGRGCNW